MTLLILLTYQKQEAFEKCWAHSPLRAPARRLFYIAIHQVSHAATVARRLCIDVHNNIDNNDKRETEGTAMAPWNGPN